MKAFFSIAFFLTSLCLQAQTVVQMHGRIFNADTVEVTAWSDGELIFRKTIVEPVYSFVLGEKPHYTIKLVGGGVTKYCHLFTFQMGVEDLTVDVDFRQPESVVVKKNHRSRRIFTYELYGVRGWRTQSVDYRLFD